jgi:hypothetical protein
VALVDGAATAFLHFVKVRCYCGGTTLPLPERPVGETNTSRRYLSNSGGIEVMSPSVTPRPTGDSCRLTCNAGAYIVESSALVGLPSVPVGQTGPHPTPPVRAFMFVRLFPLLGLFRVPSTNELLE